MMSMVLTYGEIIGVNVAVRMGGHTIASQTATTTTVVSCNPKKETKKCCNLVFKSTTTATT